MKKRGRLERREDGKDAGMEGKRKVVIRTAKGLEKWKQEWNAEENEATVDMKACEETAEGRRGVKQRREGRTEGKVQEWKERNDTRAELENWKEEETATKEEAEREGL